jgi:hypothetical protein
MTSVDALREPWKVVLVVHGETRKQVEQTYTQLQQLGFESVHVASSSEVTINKRHDTIVQQDKSWKNEYYLYRDMIKIMSNAYASQCDMFMFVRAGSFLWEQLPVYCETTIPKNTVGVWNPFTPNRVFPDEARQRPECVGTFGWCQHPINSSLAAYHCFVTRNHTLTLMASYMDEEPELGTNFGGSLALALNRYEVPMYFHLPSLAVYSSEFLLADDFVGVSHHMNQSDMRANNYIYKAEA